MDVDGIIIPKDYEVKETLIEKEMILFGFLLRELLLDFHSKILLVLKYSITI